MEEPQSPQPLDRLAKRIRAELFKKLTPSLLLAGFFGFFLSVPGAGFMVAFVAIPQIFLIPARIFTGVMNPVDRWLNLGRAVIWLAAIASIFVVHHVREDINRTYAAEIVAKLEAYSAAHGGCAARLEDVGVSPQQLHDKLGYSGYFCEGGKQHFFYPGSFLPFSSRSYDFASRKWNYRSD